MSLSSKVSIKLYSQKSDCEYVTHCTGGKVKYRGECEGRLMYLVWEHMAILF